MRTSWGPLVTTISPPAYDQDAFARLPFGRARAEQIVAEWEAAGFEDVRADPLTEVLELDRVHGVAPRPLPAAAAPLQRPPTALTPSDPLDPSDP